MRTAKEKVVLNKAEQAMEKKIKAQVSVADNLLCWYQMRVANLKRNS